MFMRKPGLRERGMATKVQDLNFFRASYFSPYIYNILINIKYLLNIVLKRKYNIPLTLNMKKNMCQVSLRYRYLVITTSHQLLLMVYWCGMDKSSNFRSKNIMTTWHLAILDRLFRYNKGNKHRFGCVSLHFHNITILTFQQLY